MPGKEAMPSTLRRSPRKAQEDLGRTHDAAAEQYGDGERAHRTAFASLKHSFEKGGDHWTPRTSEARPTRGRPFREDRRPSARTWRDLWRRRLLGHTKDELYQRAKALGIRGRSQMEQA